MRTEDFGQCQFFERIISSYIKNFLLEFIEDECPTDLKTDRKWKNGSKDRKWDYFVAGGIRTKQKRKQRFMKASEPKAGSAAFSHNYSVSQYCSNWSINPWKCFKPHFTPGPSMHVQFSSVAQSSLTVCNPMNCSMPGFPVHQQLPELTQNSCPLSQWCHPTISSSVIPFSSRPQSFPAAGSFPVSQFFASGGQSIGASASASVLPMNMDWFPLRWTGWISLPSKGLSRVFSNTTVQNHRFFSAQLSLWSNSHIHTWLLEKP